jgi:hypothetical protein
MTNKNNTLELKILPKVVLRAPRPNDNSNFRNDSFYITRNDFLVSSEPPRRNPYLKAVDYVIHGKLRDSR